MSIRPGTAADLRAYFQAKPERMALLSAGGVATVEKGSRGRVAAEAITVNNKRRSAKHQYVVGASAKTAKADANAAHRARVAAIKAGVTVGSRGPLPKAAKAVLAQSKG